MRLEKAFEAYRAEGEQPRATAYFACKELGESAFFILPELDGPFGSAPTGRHARYYRIEMPQPTKCVMRLLRHGQSVLDRPDMLAEIATAYWRQPKSDEWQYFEYLGASALILEEVDAPDSLNLATAGPSMAYGSDEWLARKLWPIPKEAG